LRLHSEIRDILIHGTFIALEAPENVIAYRRVLKDQWVNIYCNFNDKNEKVNSHINKLYLSNIKDLNIESEHIVLNPYQAIIFK
ncbi:glucohydrolase, partial [Proteus sp. fly-1067]